MLIISHVVGFLSGGGKESHLSSPCAALCHGGLRNEGTSGALLDGEVSSPRHSRAPRRRRPLRGTPPPAASLPLAPAVSSPPHQPRVRTPRTSFDNDNDVHGDAGIPEGL